MRASVCLPRRPSKIQGVLRDQTRTRFLSGRSFIRPKVEASTLESPKPKIRILISKADFDQKTRAKAVDVLGSEREGQKLYRHQIDGV